MIHVLAFPFAMDCFSIYTAYLKLLSIVFHDLLLLMNLNIISKIITTIPKTIAGELFCHKIVHYISTKNIKLLLPTFINSSAIY
jgi:hypothetical protein